MLPDYNDLVFKLDDDLEEWYEGKIWQLPTTYISNRVPVVYQSSELSESTPNIKFGFSK